MRPLGFLAALLLAASADAQLSIEPANPTSADTIYVNTSAGCYFMSHDAPVVNGSDIAINFRLDGLCLPIVSYYRIPLPQLPPGTYTLRVQYFFDGQVSERQTRTLTFTVAAAHVVPALDPRALALLAAAAVLVLRR